MLRSESDADCDRQQVGLELTLESVRRDETPDVLIARRWNAELARADDEGSPDVGVRASRPSELLESIEKARMKTGSRWRHASSVGAMKRRRVSKVRQVDLVTLCH